MLNTFLEVVGKGEVTRSNLRAVTTEAIYKSSMNDLTMPPKVELTNFKENVYPRLKHPVMEVKHGIYSNRARLFQQDRADDPYCQNQACSRKNLVQNVEHIF